MIALATTTINVPEALRLLHAHNEDVQFFVTGDTRTPHDKCAALLGELRQCSHYFSPDDQKNLGYACSDLIGWSTIGRRSIAILEALRAGADTIVVWDDDNLATDMAYFDHFEYALGDAFSGLCVDARGYWFDVGQLLVPKAPHRGFPVGWPGVTHIDHVVDAKVGVAAGICLGDPDISAVDRISQGPTVHQISEVLRAGIVVDPRTKTVFNSQNSAFIRELAPCFLLPPQWGRHDDIWASLIAQRCMRERGLHTHFGLPTVWQQRNPHNLIKDLKAEMLGMEFTPVFSAYLDELKLDGDGSVCDHVAQIYAGMSGLNWMPAGVVELGAAWVSDCRKILG